jgi:hypothetical protein
MNVDMYEVLTCVAGSADQQTLLKLRAFCKEATQICDSQPPLLKKLPAMRKGWNRRLALDAKLRSAQNQTRWRSLAQVKTCKFATLVVARHIKIGPSSAPSQKLVMDCLRALDVQLSHEGYSKYEPLGKLLVTLGGGFELEHVFRHALRGQMLHAFDKMLERHS